MLCPVKVTQKIESRCRPSHRLNDDRYGRTCIVVFPLDFSATFELTHANRFTSLDGLETGQFLDARKGLALSPQGAEV